MHGQGVRGEDGALCFLCGFLLFFCPAAVRVPLLTGFSPSVLCAGLLLFAAATGASRWKKTKYPKSGENTKQFLSECLEERKSIIAPSIMDFYRLIPQPKPEYAWRRGVPGATCSGASTPFCRHRQREEGGSETGGWGGEGNGNGHGKLEREFGNARDEN